MNSDDSVSETTVKTCKKGHPLVPGNLRGNGKGRPPICKTCKEESQAAWKLANPEFVSEGQYRKLLNERREAGVKPQNGNAKKTHCPQGHEYTEENTYRFGPDGRYRMCKTCRNEHVKASYRRHHEERLDYHRAYQEANREAYRENSRRWQQNNRERSNLLGRLKKQRRRNAGTLTVADWELVLDVYGRNCLKCGKAEVTIDHVVPVSCDGPNEIGNVQPLCGFCNTSKGTKTADYRPFPWEDAAAEVARGDAA